MAFQANFGSLATRANSKQKTKVNCHHQFCLRRISNNAVASREEEQDQLELMSNLAGLQVRSSYTDPGLAVSRCFLLAQKLRLATMDLHLECLAQFLKASS